MRTKKDEKFKLESVEELLGVVNEESAMDIEISKIQSFRAHVMECLRKNTTQVKNIKKYLLAALFNAPVTMQGYYQAEVNHAMPQFANNK